VIQHLNDLPRVGWRWFALSLQDEKHRLSQEPVVEGIYSAGGKDGVKAWMEISVCQFAVFPRGVIVDLHQQGLLPDLFLRLSSFVPPGGHMMVSYEDQDPLHQDTDRMLTWGVPPPVTPLGALLFRAGLRLVKNWYLAEGGYEGPRKLWGEKPPDEGWARQWNRQVVSDIAEFLHRTEGLKDPAWLPDLRRSAREIEKEATVGTVATV